VESFKSQEVAEAILRVDEVMLRRRKEEVVQLPEKTFLVRDIELKGEQLSRYEEVCKELLVRVTAASGETFTREINSLLEEYLRAVQIASNPRLVDENWKGEPAKFLELDEIVNEVVEEKDEKIVIWTNYLTNISELARRYEKLGSAQLSGEVAPAERQKTIERFQTAAELKVLVAIPAAGGVGITLTAAQTAVYVDKTWNAEHWLQSIDRLHRIGQLGTVNIISLHACKIDELIARNLQRKEIDQARLLGDKTKRSGAAAGSLDKAKSIPSREELLQALKRR
jgi:SNF2 family DNA or RNA helicase